MRIYEIAGWLLLVIGLFIFYLCFAMLVNDQPHIVESVPLTAIGVVVFRGGIHLLKVGAAAQACRQLSDAGSDTRVRAVGKETATR